jgi:lipoprotein NlpD
MKKSHLLLLSVIAAQLVACSTTQNNAPVERRTASTIVEPVKPSVAAPHEGAGFYTVKQGETLYRIALESGQTPQDLIAWNNLANPNDIKVGQVLRVAPPSAAPGTAQVGTVTAGTSGLEIKPLSPGKAPATSGTTNLTGPRGDKRPYSEQTLAELGKPDVVGTSAVPPAPATTAPAAAPVVAAPAATAPAASVAADDATAPTWIWPTEGKVTGVYDAARKGVDIAGTAGQTIAAAADGKVMYAGSGIRGYGNLVIIKHNNNLLSAYAHNRTILVKEGQTVVKGQKIAEMGNSDSTNVKLHFEIRQQGKPVDPMPYLPPR